MTRSAWLVPLLLAAACGPGAIGSADAAYASVRREVGIVPGTARLRFQIYLQDPPTIRADEMFVDALE